MAKRTLQQKLEYPSTPEIKTGPETWNKRFGGNRMLIATPRLIEAIVKTIPYGETLTMSELRKRLAIENGADYTCPLTTGIFAIVMAEAAHERQDCTVPWWRLVKDDGSMNDKFPMHGPLQHKYLREEGHRLTVRGQSLKLSPLT